KGEIVMYIVQVTFIFSLIFGGLVLWEFIPPRGVAQITVIELRKMLKDRTEYDYQYIDVRNAEKFNRMHVYGFKNIPLIELKKKAEKVEALSKDKKNIVMSQKGNNGNEAFRILKKRGFTNLANVRGGFITCEPHK